MGIEYHSAEKEFRQVTSHTLLIVVTNKGITIIWNNTRLPCNYIGDKLFEDVKVGLPYHINKFVFFLQN